MIAAELSAGDLAAVVVSVLSLVAVAVLTASAIALLRTTRQLRDTVAEVREVALPALHAATAGVGDAREEMERVQEILAAAEAVSSRIDGASRVAYLALSKPVIKTAAAAAGTRRAARRLRSSEE